LEFFFFWFYFSFSLFLLIWWVGGGLCWSCCRRWWWLWCFARPSMKGMILVEKYRRMRVPSVEKWGEFGLVFGEGRGPQRGGCGGWLSCQLCWDLSSLEIILVKRKWERGVATSSPSLPLSLSLSLSLLSFLFTFFWFFFSLLSIFIFFPLSFSFSF